MMFRARGKRGVVLLIVLGMVLVVAILAQAILSIILSHSRFTHHQTSRIQAYYAAMAGTNFALEQLRTGAWDTNDCPNTYPATCTVPETFPSPIQSIGIIFCPAGNTCCPEGPPCLGFPQCNPPAGSGISFCIQTTTVYTYTAP